MLNNKRFLVLTGIFGLLLIYVLLTQTGNKGYNTVSLPEFKPVALENLTEVQLGKSDQTLVFQKKDNEWFITQPIEFKADKNKINALIKSLTDTRLTDKLSEQGADNPDYGLNSLNAFAVTMVAQDGKKVFVKLGNPNQGGTHTFAVLKDNPAVYQVIGNFQHHLTMPVEDWRSLSIFDFSRDTIQTFRIKQKGKSDIVVKKEEMVEENIVADSPQGVTPTTLPTKVVWKAEGEATPLADPKVNQFLNAFSRLSANQIIEKTEEILNPLATVTVTTNDKTYTLEVVKYDKSKNQYTVQGPADKVWYILPEYQVKNFLKEPADFKK